MERILTFAEFAKHAEQVGGEAGNSQKDVDALVASTDEFTAPTDGEGCSDGSASGLKTTPTVQDEPDVVVAVEGTDSDEAPEEEKETEEDEEDEEDGKPIF